MKKISVLLVSALVAGCLFGCNSKPAETGGDGATDNFKTPTVNVDYLEGQTTLSETVEVANKLANGVQAYYENSDRLAFISQFGWKVENEPLEAVEVCKYSEKQRRRTISVQYNG